MDAATCLTSDKDQPQPHDITICFYCGTCLEWQDDMTFAIADLDQLDSETTSLIARATSKIMELNKKTDR
jgi:hypothetical protein